jgi:hypothetical protein
VAPVERDLTAAWRAGRDGIADVLGERTA